MHASGTPADIICEEPQETDSGSAPLEGLSENGGMEMNVAGIGRIILYSSDVEAMVAFYAHHFGFRAKTLLGDELTELTPVEGGAALLIQRSEAHQPCAEKQVELVFDVADVDDFVARALERGLEFDAVRQAKGYRFSQTLDPSGNRISVSSLAFTPRG
ncbi:VOC family protein [Rhizobium helianthi]|uniref:VOC family protein n=1 Tax=Rhizobium helianthi TaxID=1132695 RepID=A0ABW4M6S2_9HYPH